MNGERKIKREHNSFSDLTLTDVKTWTPTDVANFLQLKGFTDEANIFKESSVTGAELECITETRLVELGINDVRQKILLMDTMKNFRRQLQMNSNPTLYSKDNYKVFNDSIHGHIELHQACVHIIDTPEFQRLRDLLQVGGCYYVFPGASHKRFEHSLGVCHLAGQLARTIQERQPELDITEIDILCVEMAGLCHDLGHGPYSHMFDGNFIPRARPGYKWKHEVGSVQMFDHLIEKNNLMPVLRSYGLTEKDCKFIKEQISGVTWDGQGEWPFVGRDRNKMFLYEIVSNKRNGIDVDRWDYFGRDCHHLGVSNNFDHMRLMKFVRVLQVEGQMQICCRDKEVGTVFEMFRMRHMLHRRVYEHNVKNIIEYMLCEAFQKADNYLLFKGKNGTMLPLSHTIDDMEAYSKVSDNIYYRIRYSDDPRLRPAQQILEMIEQRKLYYCIGRTKPVDTSKSNVCKHTEQEICDEIIAMMDTDIGSDTGEDTTHNNSNGTAHTDTTHNDTTHNDTTHSSTVEVTNEDLIVQVIKLDYGMKTHNPVDYVRFYRKNDPTKAYRLTRDEVSEMLPQCFQESYIQVYCRSTDAAVQSTAYRRFIAWCKKHSMVVPKESSTFNMVSPSSSDYVCR